MKKLVGMLALASISAFGAEITGFVADSSCGAKHADASDSSAACAKRCIARGSDAVLVTKDGKVYKIDSASQAKLKEMAGKTVTVSGDVSGDTVTVASVK
ncbi:MAG: hypothetical protein LAO79_17010 [Acidobacteriia bacterium]|nr:hypothetical protein [Terriglobia bacterium]